MNLLTINFKNYKNKKIHIIKTKKNKTPQSNLNLMKLGIIKNNIGKIDLNNISYQLKLGIKISTKINNIILNNINIKKNKWKKL